MEGAIRVLKYPKMAVTCQTTLINIEILQKEYIFEDKFAVFQNMME